MWGKCNINIAKGILPIPKWLHNVLFQQRTIECSLFHKCNCRCASEQCDSQNSRDRTVASKHVSSTPSISNYKTFLTNLSPLRKVTTLVNHTKFVNYCIIIPKLLFLYLSVHLIVSH